ncbi:MAG: flagellar hook-length control protein FliK [Chitinophagaceae bacterium]|nr:flagellar hook-length control protein FliK [Oligoflexus sp.]
MINLPSPSLPKRPGLNDGPVADAAAPSETSSQSPSQKSAPKFEDHLNDKPAAAPKAPAPKQGAQAAKGAQQPSAQAAKAHSQERVMEAKAPQQRGLPQAQVQGAKAAPRDDRQNLRSPEPNGTPLAPNKSMKAPAPPLQTKADAHNDTNSEAVKTTNETPSADASGNKVQIKSNGLMAKNADQADTKALDPNGNDASKGGSVLVIQAEDIPASEKANLDAGSLDLKKDESESWEKRLEDMLAFMGVQPQAMPQQLPALAILTGQLQFVEAESIPTTLAQSPMLGNVMSSADPEQIVNQVKPLGTWLDDMGWSPDGLIVQDPVAFQDLMNTPVSLKDLMKSFNVDPGRVTAEAKILQDTLPLEGAVPYIARANRMKADPTLPQRSPKTDSALAQQIQTQALPRDQAVAPMDAEFLSVIMSASIMSQQPVNAQTSPTSFEPKPKDVAPLKAESHSASPTSSLDQMLAAMAQGPSFEGLPKATLSNENPFQTMELRSTDTFIFKTDAPQGEAPVLQSRADRQNWLEGIQSLALRPETSDGQTSDKARSFDPSVLLERLSEITLGNTSDFKQSSGEEKGDDALEQTAGDLVPGMFASNQTHKSQGAFSLAGPETPAKTEAPKHLEKAVFENASLLVKDGGGSIRIDIGNKEIGAVDLAVEVKDNVVDIKIVAASPHAREILATELPKLRESLHSQNLNLSKVEIGLSGGSSWTSSDGRSSSSQRESSSQSDEVFGVSGAGRKSSKSYRQVSSTQNLGPQVITDGGSIKVRV